MKHGSPRVVDPATFQIPDKSVVPPPKINIWQITPVVTEIEGDQKTFWYSLKWLMQDMQMNKHQ